MANNNTHQLITRNSGYIQNQVKDPPSAEIFYFLTQQSKANIRKYIDEWLPAEYEKR